MKLRIALLTAVLMPACCGIVHAQGEYTTYKVKPGDGLDAIARRFHTNTPALLKANQVGKPDELEVGQVLRVPKPADPLADAGSALAESHAPKKVETIHVSLAEKNAPAPKPQLDESRISTKSSHKEKPTAATASVAENSVAEKAAPAVPAVQKPSKPFLKDYEDPQRGEKEPSMGYVVGRLFVSLIIVLAIAYGSIYVLRLFMGRQGPLPRKKGHLKVLESASLGPNRSIHLVRVGDEVMVLGATPDQITTISKIEDPEVVNQLITESTPRPFAAHLDGALSDESRPELADQVRGGITHLWDRVQEIRGLQTPKGGSSK